MPLGDTWDGILVCQAPVSCVRLTSCVFFLFCIVPNFNILKTCSWHFQCKLGYFGVSIVLQTLTWAGGSLTCVCGPFACVCTRGDLGLQSHLSDFCRVCTEFDSGEISWRLQSLACNSNASISMVTDHAGLCFNFGFWEQMLLPLTLHCDCMIMCND